DSWPLRNAPNWRCAPRYSEARQPDVIPLTVEPAISAALATKRDEGAEEERSAVSLFVFVVRRSRRLVFLRLVVEGLVGDAEDLGGLAAVTVGHVERLFDD